MTLILASTSPYRRRLLERLQVPFACRAPGTDEARRPEEPARALAARLALDKARAVAETTPGALIIGSDQVAAHGEEILGKPGGHASAFAQLRDCSGAEVVFYTAVALVGQNAGLLKQHVEPVTVRFRALTDAAIDSYLRREQPYDCAGSFKCEGLGIALFERIDSADPTALEGLPLIALSGMLREAGCEVLA